MYAFAVLTRRSKFGRRGRHSASSKCAVLASSSFRHWSVVNVKLAFDLVDAANVPRLPELRWLDMGHDSERAKIPLFALAPFESSAVAKVIATFDTLETGLGRQ